MINAVQRDQDSETDRLRAENQRLREQLDGEIEERREAAKRRAIAPE